MGLTSGVCWTLVVDSFSSWGSLPCHREKVLIFTYLMRCCGSKWEIHRSEMKCSLASRQKKKNHHAHTPTDTYAAIEKKGTENHKKQDTNQCSPAATPNLIPLYIAQCSLSVSLPQYCISFPLHLTPSFYSSVFSPPLPVFHNPDEKRKKKKTWSALKIFQGGRRALAEAMRRDEEGQRAWREREKIWYDVPLQCQQTRSSSCVKRDLRATQNKEVMVKPTLSSLSFVACQSSMQARIHVGFRLLQKIRLHIHTRLQSRGLVKHTVSFSGWHSNTEHGGRRQMQKELCEWD